MLKPDGVTVDFNRWAGYIRLSVAATLLRRLSGSSRPATPRRGFSFCPGCGMTTQSWVVAWIITT